MTKLTKPVVRVTGQFYKHYKRPIIVALEPAQAGDVIAVRLKGDPESKALRAPISAIMTQLYIWQYDAATRIELEGKKAKKLVTRARKK